MNVVFCEEKKRSCEVLRGTFGEYSEYEICHDYFAHGQENWPFLTYIGGSGEDNAHLVTSDALVKTFVVRLTRSVGPPFTDEPPRFCSTRMTTWPCSLAKGLARR